MEENKPPQKPEVETYAGDMAGVMEGSDSGLIKKIIKEQSVYEEAQIQASPEALKNKLYLYAGILLTLLAVGIVTYLIATRQEVGTVSVEPQFTPIIFLDETSFVEVSNISREEIFQEVVLEASTGEIKKGGVEGLYLAEDKNIVGLPRFLELIEASLPKEKVPLFGENFLMGAVNNGSKDFFILLPAQSFTEVFNEMRIWEAKMFGDLHKFFNFSINSTNNYLLRKNFDDGIVENKNARILHDNEGNIMLMYVFIDNTSIIISNTENAVREVMLRLASSKVKK